MPTLLVMRHAKSDWNTGVSDHDRPLNGRGRKSAEAMGRWLADLGEVPEVAWTSTAERARTTLELAMEAGGWDTEVHEVGALYGAGIQDSLAVGARTPNGVERAMLVGHMPTWAGVVEHLSGGRVAMKTGTVVGLDLFGSWDDLPTIGAEIRFVLQPRLVA